MSLSSYLLGLFSPVLLFLAFSIVALLAEAVCDWREKRWAAQHLRITHPDGSYQYVQTP